MKPLVLSLSLLIAAVSAVPSASAAGDVAQLATEAEELLASGQVVEAHDRMRAAYIDLWSRGPLVNRQEMLIVEPAPGLGSYQVKDPPHYAPGEPIYLYLEPIGYGWTGAAEGQVIHFVVDAGIKVRGGALIWQQAGFTELSVTSGQQMTEFFANLTYTFDGLGAGDYTLVTTLNDQATGKAVTTELDFGVRE